MRTGVFYCAFLYCVKHHHYSSSHVIIVTCTLFLVTCFQYNLMSLFIIGLMSPVVYIMSCYCLVHCVIQLLVLGLMSPVLYTISCHCWYFVSCHQFCIQSHVIVGTLSHVTCFEYNLMSLLVLGLLSPVLNTI